MIRRECFKNRIQLRITGFSPCKLKSPLSVGLNQPETRPLYQIEREAKYRKSEDGVYNFLDHNHLRRVLLGQFCDAVHIFDFIALL